MSRKRVILGTAAVSTAAVVAALVSTGSPASASISQPSMHALGGALAMPFGSVLRQQQDVGGIPVFGGQLVQIRDRAGHVLATHGRTTQKTEGQFPATSAGATDAAIADVAKRTGRPAGQLTADAPQPYWYDATLGGAKGDSVAVPTYQVVVHGKRFEDKWTEVVKAGTQQALASWSDVREANRDVCDANRTVVSGSNDSVRCGTAFKVDRKEGGADSSVADVNNVYNFFGEASDFYSKYVNVDLTKLIGADYGDGTGAALRGTVRICVDGECPFANAFWDGEQMAFGEGVTTDDITGHELTHGVTQHTSGLSGGQADSINEGLSDVFGKFIGITSNDPNDTNANRWLIGAGSSLGAIRNMKDPRSSLSPQPDMVNGPGWQTDNPDVHINDGVVNKTDYLITDGDTFNGKTVKGLGLDKSIQVWWGVENTLTQSATFSDVGAALNSSCSALAKAGTAGITADDCTQVSNAVLATQLNQDPK